MIGIELLAAAQGIDFHRPLRSSAALERALDHVRGAIPHHSADRYLADDIAWARQSVLDGRIVRRASRAALLIDLDQAGEDLSLEGEVCVIGAGAAGISLARRLLAAGHEVILLESGGLDYEAADRRSQCRRECRRGLITSSRSRLRFFGGTTAIWGGRCAELDPIDLEKRD